MHSNVLLIIAFYNLKSVTHEIGHLLGMRHDFKSHKQWCKKVSFSKGSLACKECINWNEAEEKLTALSDQEKEKAIKENLNYCCTGLMDYGEHPQEWSYCSRRDFERHYISENWASCMPTGNRPLVLSFNTFLCQIIQDNIVF